VPVSALGRACPMAAGLLAGCQWLPVALAGPAPTDLEAFEDGAAIRPFADGIGVVLSQGRGHGQSQEQQSKGWQGTGRLAPAVR